MVLAAEDGLVSVSELGLDIGTDTGAHRTIALRHQEGPAAMDVAIWWRDQTNPDNQHRRIAVFIRHNADSERIFEAVFDVLREAGWDVPVFSSREVEADPVGSARSVLQAQPLSSRPEPTRLYLVTGSDEEQ